MQSVMFLRFLFIPAASVLLFAATSCSDNSSAPQAVQSTEPAATVLMTSGVLHLKGLPLEGITAKEVIVVENLDAEGRKRILRQRELFESKITGKVVAVEEVSSMAGVLPADATELEAAMAALRSQFPPALVVDVDLGNNRLRKYQSDAALFKAYQYLFKSLNWDNLERV